VNGASRSCARRDPASPDVGGFAQVQIVGPFHSGTCLVFLYLQALFDVHVRYHTLFWKHSLLPRFRGLSDNRTCDIAAPPPDVFDWTLFLCMVRLPYFWVLSTLRQPYGIALVDDNAGDASAALRSAIRFEDRIFANHVQLWNAYYRAYHEHLVPHAAVKFVRLEDLVQTPENVLGDLGRCLRRRKDADLDSAIAEISNRPAKVHGGPCVYGEEARREYVPERVPNRFPPHDIEFINGQLDPELMRRFAYPFIDGTGGS